MKQTVLEIITDLAAMVRVSIGGALIAVGIVLVTIGQVIAPPREYYDDVQKRVDSAGDKL